MSVPRRPNVRFLHVLCNDVAPIRRFYSERLGLDEISHRDDTEGGWVAYQCEGLQLMFHRWSGSDPVPVFDGFAWQPGDGEGTVPAMSFAVGIAPEDYRVVVERLQASRDLALTPAPTWRQNSYWGWTVKDPMGNTIELFTMVAERPEGNPPVWS